MGKKRSTLLWVIGWLFIFPVPLTILMLRNKNVSKMFRIGAIAAAWFVYAAIGLSGSSTDSINSTETFNNSVSEQSVASASDTAVLETAETFGKSVEDSAAESSQDALESNEDHSVAQELGGVTSERQELSSAEDSERDAHDTTATGNYDTLEVHFLDVGQGDCTLLKCGNQTMVIDCGDSDKGTAVQYYLSKQGVDSIDYLVLTHPDSDHIGGAPVIITKFDIGAIYMSNYTKDNRTYENVTNAISYRSYSWTTPAVGDTVTLGSATITFLAPSKEYDDPNDASIALVVRNGETSFLFSGDAEEVAEKNIIATGLDLDVDVYQVGHHGSSTSSSVDFLDVMTPTYAVISCAEGNSYGFPHAETLNNLRSMGVEVFRTDEQGSIIATSDGETITWNCAPSETWQAGEKTDSSTTTSETISNEQAIESSAESGSATAESATTENVTYVLNTNTMKYHRPTCSSVEKIADKNRQDTTMSKEEIEAQGYVGCKNCNP